MKSKETFTQYSAGDIETKEKDQKSNVDQLLDKVKSIKARIGEKLNISGKELDDATDEALVYVAQETIAAADADGVREEHEKAQIKNAVSQVVVQGASESVTGSKAPDSNPIVELDKPWTAPDLDDAIATFHANDEKLPSGESVAEVAVSVIEGNNVASNVEKSESAGVTIGAQGGAVERRLEIGRNEDGSLAIHRVGEALGSNPGGWYESDKGGRFYVKFYDDPDQGRIECVANEIYRRLGIHVPDTEMATVDGRTAFVSKAVDGGGQRVAAAEMGGSPDVASGFVADAFLGNWDVVGAGADNIVKADDEHFYRIDNGGALIYRARGESKEYVPTAIPELETMLERGSGKIVFANVSQDDVARQAKELVGRLSSEDIKDIVRNSGLRGYKAYAVLQGLLGRREYLAKKYDNGEATSIEADKKSPEKVTLAEAIESARSGEFMRTPETALRPRAETVCDRDHIEDQRIDVVNCADEGVTRLSFKAMGMNLDVGGEKSKITRSKTDSLTGESRKICEAVEFRRDGVDVRVASDRGVRASFGLVQIDIPNDMDASEAQRTVGQIMTENLGIADALAPVDADSLRRYKEARYRWQYKIDGPLTPEQQAAAECLRLKEVLPGYTTLIDPGKHEEYECDYGQIRAIHDLRTGSPSSIYRVLTQGVLCSSERYLRGVLRNGMSTYDDFVSGGADGAFTRLKRGDMLGDIPGGARVVFKPDLLDRTDWYAYNGDKYGSTAPDAFSGRLSPDEMLSAVYSGQTSLANEQVFRTGIGPQYIESVIVANASDRSKVVEYLKMYGITSFDGKPIEDVIVVRDVTSAQSDATPIAEASINVANAKNISLDEDKINLSDVQGVKDSISYIHTMAFLGSEPAKHGALDIIGSIDGSAESKPTVTALSSDWDMLNDLVSAATYGEKFEDYDKVQVAVIKKLVGVDGTNRDAIVESFCKANDMTKEELVAEIKQELRDGKINSVDLEIGEALGLIEDNNKQSNLENEEKNVA